MLFISATGFSLRSGDGCSRRTTDRRIHEGAVVTHPHRRDGPSGNLGIDTGCHGRLTSRRASLGMADDWRVADSRVALPGRGLEIDTGEVQADARSDGECGSVARQRTVVDHLDGVQVGATGARTVRHGGRDLSVGVASGSVSLPTGGEHRKAEEQSSNDEKIIAHFEQTFLAITCFG